MSYQEFIRETQSPHFWLGLIPEVLVTGSSFAALFRNFTHLRLIADTPTSLIRSDSQGYVELHGTTRVMPRSHAPRPEWAGSANETDSSLETWARTP